MAYAEAVNAEVKDLFAAGADVVQLDEPWFRNAPDRARAYGVEVVNRSLLGRDGTTAHPPVFWLRRAGAGKQAKRYAYLEELADSTVDQISIEAAQPRLDLAPLATLARGGQDDRAGLARPGRSRRRDGGATWRHAFEPHWPVSRPSS